MLNRYTFTGRHSVDGGGWVVGELLEAKLSAVDSVARLPDHSRKSLSHEEQIDVRFHLLYARLAVE